MEMTSFLKHQSLAALVLIPLAVGAGVAVFFGATEDRPFDASTTVNVAEGLDADPESFGITGRVDDFIFTVQSRTVEAVVREELGLASSDPGGELTAKPVGNGSLVEVTHRADTAETAVAGLDAGVATALRALADQQLDRATTRVSIVDQQMTTLNGRLAELEAAAGGPDVASQYRDTVSRIQALETTLAERAGDPTFEAEPVTAFIAELDTRRVALAGVLNEWEQVRVRLDRASEARETAELEQLAAAEVVEAATAGDRFFATELSQASTSEVVALPAIAAAIAAFGVVLGATLLRERSQHRARSAPAPAPMRATRANGTPRDARAATPKPRTRATSTR